MAKGIQDLGDNLGYLYKTLPDGVTILTTERNTQDGARAMRVNGLVNAPLAASRSAVGTITVTSSGGAGAITAINIAAVNQIGANINVVSAVTSVVAAQIAAAINAFTPGSGDNYTAQAVGAVVYVFSSPGAGSASNGLTITVSVTDPSIVTTTTNFTNGSSEAGVYDSQMGYRYWIDADYGSEGTPGAGTATPTVLTYALEITEYMTMRGFQTGVGTLSLTVATDALTTVERFCAITQIVTTNQGGAGTDNLEYINPTKFVEGDIVFIRSTSASQVLTVIDAANATVASNPNIYLTDENSFIIQRNKVLMLRYTFDNTLGGIFVEMSRSFTGGIVSLTRASLLTLISSNSIDIDQTYYVTDVGADGILLTGVESDQVSSMAYLIAINPDYQDVSGDYGGTWYAGMGVPTINKLYAYNGIMYNSDTAAVGTAPDGDTVNWTAIALTDPRYVREVDYIGYDLANNFINYREDKRGNKVSQSYQGFLVIGANAINEFQWGNDKCYNNTVTNALAVCANQANEFYGNTIVNGGGWASETTTSMVVSNNYFNNSISSGDTYTNFKDNVLNYVSMSGNTGTNFTNNTLDGCTITNNTTTNITYCTGYVSITSNTGCTIATNSGAKNWVGVTINNLIDANADCSISGNNFEMGTINNNDGITVAYNKVLNGYIQNCVNNNYPALPAASCLISQIEIKNEAKIDSISWNTAGSIQRGVISGNYGQIVDVLFDSSVAIATVSATQTGIDQFDLDGLTIDGNGTALSFQTNTTSGFGSQYGYVSINNNQSAAWGFLNMASASIFAAGVLTIPIENSHAGILYLYNCAGQNVTEIIVNANIKNLKKFPITFRWIHGAGTVTFTPNARPLAGNEFGSDAGAEVLTALGDSYTLEFIGGNFYKKYSSIIL